jgi:hypothetical protein
MLTRSTNRLDRQRRSNAAARQRRHAARMRAKIVVCAVEVDATVVEVLIELGYVVRHLRHDRAVLGVGIAAALRSLLLTRQP